MGEVAPRPAYLPDAFVRLLPFRFEEPEQSHLYPPCRRFRFQAGVARDVQRIHHFAVDVELELARRRVADAHRPGVGVPG